MATESRPNTVFFRTLIGGLGLLVSASTALAQPAFYLMGNVGANTYSKVWGLSYDGKTACGTHDGPNGGAFMWSLAGGRQDALGLEFYRGISADGKVVTGTKLNPNSGSDELIRRTIGGATEYLGVLSGFGGSAGAAITPDTNTIVGLASKVGGSNLPSAGPRRAGSSGSPARTWGITRRPGM